jgi:UDP-glucose 4-epimerase
MPDGKRVLVTGGAGFIGANLLRMLLQQGYGVTVFDNLSTGKLEYLEGLEVRVVEGDIRDAQLASEAVPGHDAVVHLAAQTGVPGSLEDPRRDCAVNILGTLNFLEACRANGARLVFASSNAPLGRQEPPATEDKAPLPVSPYGASKLAGEGYCLAYHGSWGLDTVVFRFANVYGPHSLHKGSVVAKFFKDALAGTPIVIDGDGGQTRDFVHVDDLCHAIVLALKSDVAGEVFQLATGVETSILELADLVREITAAPLEASHGPPRQGDVRKNYSDVSKAQRVLGWRPQVALREGLEATWEWYSRAS